MYFNSIKHKIKLIRVASVLIVTSIWGIPVAAEIDKVTIAETSGIAFLQLQVMRHEGLIEKHAQALGLKDLEIEWKRFGGAGAVNDAMLSGNVDLASAGVPGFLILQDRTRNLSDPVVGISSLGSIPNLLNTNDENIKSIRDFKSNHKIAVPSLRVSVQAILMQMAAEKEWGENEHGRLDSLMVGIPASDAVPALINNIVTANFTTPPYQYYQLENPNIHNVLSSFDILGGSASLIILYAKESFKNDNPKTFSALLSALKEATEFINADKKRAVEIYKNVTNDNTPTDELVAMISRPEFSYTLTPERIMGYADFMFRTGTLKNKTDSWKDLFVSEIHDLPGS